METPNIADKVVVVTGAAIAFSFIGFVLII